MPFANTPRSSIHFREYGAGPHALVLIPGLGARASEWGESFLSALAKQLRVICLDNRGVGRSTTTDASWTLDDMANDVCAVLDALGLCAANIAGSSMGGFVAQRLAATMPERVQRLVLMSTSLLFGKYPVEPPTPEATATLLPRFGMSSRERHLHLLTTLMAPGFAREHPALIEQIVAAREAAPIPGMVFRAHSEAMIQTDKSDYARNLRVPVLVLHGELDPLIPIANARLLAEETARARAVWLEGCGHFPQLEQPETCAGLITRFVFPPGTT